MSLQFCAMGPIRLAGAAALLLSTFLAQNLPPLETIPPTRDAYRIPPPATDADIQKAITAAKKDGKPVLLDLGAAWCIDCRILWRNFERPEIAKILADSFHLIEVNIGDEVDGFWTKWADPKKTGLPTIVLVDGNGAVIPNNTGVRWRIAGSFSAETVKSYLLDLAEIGRKHMQAIAVK